MTKILSCLLPMTIMALTASESFGVQSLPTDKGSMIVSGGFTFSSAGGDLYESGEGDREVFIQFNPSLGYLVAPGVAVGGKFLLEYLFAGEDRSDTWAIGPHITYFFGADRSRPSARGMTCPYLTAAFLYSHHTTRIGPWPFFPPTEFTHSGLMMTLGGGAVRMVSSGVGIFGEANYVIERVNWESGRSESGDRFNLLAGFMVFVH